MIELAQSIRSAFPDSVFASPATNQALAKAEALLGVALPSKLVDLYRSFNGFQRPSGVWYLLPLLEPEDGALVHLTLFHRDKYYVPRAVQEAVVFGLSTLDHLWAMSLDSQRIFSWDHGMGMEFEQHDLDILDLYRADNQRYYGPSN